MAHTKPFTQIRLCLTKSWPWKMEIVCMPSRQAGKQTDRQAPSISIIDIFNLFWLPIVLMARQTLLQRRKRFAMYRNLITLLSILSALLWKPAAAVPKGHFLVALESMQQFLLDCKWRHFLAALKSRQWFCSQQLLLCKWHFLAALESRQWFLQPARIPLHMASFFFAAFESRQWFLQHTKIPLQLAAFCGCPRK